MIMLKRFDTGFFTDDTDGDGIPDYLGNGIRLTNVYSTAMATWLNGWMKTGDES